MAETGEVWHPPPEQQSDPTPQRRVVSVKGFLGGLAVNLLCCVVFLVAAWRLTVDDPVSTSVLSCAPLIQGGLIALPVIWVFKLIHGSRRVVGLALGLLLGILLQLGCFGVWYERWIQIYAG